MFSQNNLVLSDELVFKPVVLRNSIDENTGITLELVKTIPGIEQIDTLKQQITELIKIRNPTVSLTNQAMDDEIKKKLGHLKMNEYGIWVYYPWLLKIVHLLDEEEFIEVRTSRNKYKINPEEQSALRTRKVGVIGLSVGKTVAITMVMERICSEIRIADFDHLDLSNLNRLRGGLHQIGLPKVVITAREIAEIDPFIRVECFPEGVTDQNLHSFIEGNGKLDLLVDECDHVPMKIKCRIQAKESKVPVVMDTSDKGMVDIERFDLEKDRMIFHGLIENFKYHEMESLQPNEKTALLMSLASFENATGRMKFSFSEIGKTITTWPQLASAVTLGGGVITDISRRILLGENIKSGRYYIDLETIFN